MPNVENTTNHRHRGETPSESREGRMYLRSFSSFCAFCMTAYNNITSNIWIFSQRLKERKVTKHFNFTVFSTSFKMYTHKSQTFCHRKFQNQPSSLNFVSTTSVFLRSISISEEGFTSTTTSRSMSTMRYEIRDFSPGSYPKRKHIRRVMPRVLFLFFFPKKNENIFSGIYFNIEHMDKEN